MKVDIEQVENGWVVSQSGICKHVFTDIKEVFLYLIKIFKVGEDGKD